jgi:predicted GIY-YIG superfamily endonuclease
MLGITLDLKSTFKPCVYYILDENKHPIYIGASKNGLRRIYTAPQTTEVYRALAFEEGCFATVVFFETEEDAFVEERKQIKYWKPKYNAVGVPGGRHINKPPVRVKKTRTKEDFIDSQAAIARVMLDHDGPLSKNALRRLVHPERWPTIDHTTGIELFNLEFNWMVEAGLLYEDGKSQRSIKYSFDQTAK